MSRGFTRSQVPLARKIALVRLIERVVRLQSSAYNKHVRVHVAEALTRRAALAPELARELQLLENALAGRSERPREVRA